MNKTKKIIISSVILFSLTTWVYASTLNFSEVKTIINNLQSSTSDKIWDFWDVLANIFDSSWYIKTDFIDKTKIQSRVSSSCPSDKAIQSINENWSVF